MIFRWHTFYFYVTFDLLYQFKCETAYSSSFLIQSFLGNN